MKKETDLTLGISQPDKVDEYMANLQHPMKAAMEHLRKFILGVDKSIGEGIFWNAPTFYYTGKMKPFDSKTYKRYIVGFNFYKQDVLRMIFLRGADADNSSGLLEGDYKDGRRLISFKSVADIKKNEPALKKIIKELISKIDQ
jgi:hypothetical protein